MEGNYYKQEGVYCSACRQRSGAKMSNDWFYQHSSPWHSLKWWFKYKLTRKAVQ